MRFTKTILENGVRIITAPMQGNPTVTVMIGVATGSFNEAPEQSGISHFLEHMCFKGTQKRPSARHITTELDTIGAAYNAFTGRELTGFWTKADTRHFAQIADVCADIFKESVFPEKELEKEKGVVLGEIDMYADDPQEKVAEALMKHMYRGEPAARDILGTKETVAALTRADVASYRDKQYTGPNTVVSIAGGIPEETMIEWARAALGGLSRSMPLPEFATADREQARPEVVFVDKDTDQAHVIVSWRTFDRSHPDRYVARIIKNILRGGMSSRLFIRLRDEMGSGYYVQASHSTHETFGNFSISTGTKHERVAEIVSAILEEARRLSIEAVASGELAKIKEFMRAHRVMGLETSEDVAHYLGEQEIIFREVKTPQEQEKIFAAITAEDVMRVAQAIFNPAKLTVAAIGRGIDKDAVEKLLAGLSR